LCALASSVRSSSVTLRQHGGRSGTVQCGWVCSLSCCGLIRLAGPCECPCAPPEALAMRCTTLSSSDVNAMPAKKQNVAYLCRPYKYTHTSQAATPQPAKEAHAAPPQPTFETLGFDVGACANGATGRGCVPHGGVAVVATLLECTNPFDDEDLSERHLRHINLALFSHFAANSIPALLTLYPLLLATRRCAHGWEKTPPSVARRETRQQGTHVEHYASGGA
jgi:hypothetical protein